MDNATRKAIIRSLFKVINHSVVILVWFYLIMSKEFAYEERAIYAMCAVLVWMGIQRLVKKLMPEAVSTINLE